MSIQSWWTRSDSLMHAMMDFLAQLYEGAGGSEATSTSSAFAVLQKVTATLTDAQIKALPTTPVTILDSPGADKAIAPFFIAYHMKGVDYADIDPTATIVARAGTEVFLPVRNDTQSGVTALLAGGGGDDGSLTYGTLKFGVRSSFNAAGFAQLSGLYESDVVDKPFTVRATNGAVGDFTGGDPANTLRVTVYYVIFDVP